MYFLRTRGAIVDLQADLIDDRETLKYFFGLAVITGFGLPLVFVSEGGGLGFGLIDIFAFVVSLAVFFVLLRKCYDLNANADGKNDCR